MSGTPGDPLCNRSCERVERVSAALATQLSRAMAQNSKYATALQAIARSTHPTSAATLRSIADEALK